MIEFRGRRSTDAMQHAPLATVYGRLCNATTGNVGPEAVQHSLGLRSRYLAERLLVALDRSGRGFASAADFANAAEAMMVAPVEEKIRFLFRMQDHDGDGRICREEFERMIDISMAEQGLQVAPDAPARLVDAVFASADVDGSGTLTEGEFLAMVAHRPALCQRLAAQGVTLLVPGRRARALTEAAGAGHRWTGDRVVTFVFLGMFVVANVAAFAHGFIAYRHASIFVQIARGCGAAINLDTALIVVPMLRGLWTWVRRRKVGRFLPVDEAIDAHRLVGETLMGLAVVHTLAHVANLVARGLPWSTFLTGPWLTGLLLVWIFSLMWTFSRRRVRRTGDFELFHFSHLLYVPFFVLALVHGPSLWMWAGLPLVGYAVERVIRARRSGSATHVLSAVALPAGVVRLDVRRPTGFVYTAGDYAFIRIPAIARHEWHPFTLTSAPEDAEVLTFHIRALGNWTTALHTLAKREAAGGIEVHVDGPYGAPATHLPESEHAVAIAAGIGVTPFAAILRSILLRAQMGHGRLRKLHFVWLSREQESFGWFTALLLRLEALDLFDIRIYMTKGRGDLDGGALDLARELDHERRGGDLVTGLAAKTTFGRPDFPALLREFVAEADLPPPDVYFCGPAAISGQLQRLCRAYGLAYREERF